MPRIRIAQRAWEGASGVDEIGPSTVGIGLIWIELDGVRFTDVESAVIRMDDGDAVPEIAVRIFGTLDIAYLDRNDQEITTVNADAADLIGRRFEHGLPSVIPAPLDPARLVEQRDLAIAEAARLRRMLGIEIPT